jgi:hypothetical protein
MKTFQSFGYFVVSLGLTDLFFLQLNLGKPQILGGTSVSLRDNNFSQKASTMFSYYSSLL